MNSQLLEQIDSERLPVVDGELLFWPQTELGMAYEHLLERLMAESPWRQEEISIYGKAYRQPRLSAWHGDLGYSYSGIRLEPEPWTSTLLDIRERVEKLAGHQFNSVLLNYYRDQNDKMGMHSDDETELGRQPVIASLSLGESRTLLLRHKTRKDLATIKLPLPSGSLLVMRGDTQHHWRHGINAERAHCGPRINLTFRTIKPLAGRGTAR